MPVPILMYHVISKAPVGVANAELWVGEDVFAEQMRALHAAGYEAITLQQAWEGWERGGPLPRKPIVLSFDDGYLSHYTHAKPVLRELRWPGVLYLTIKAIGPGGLTEHQLRSLIKAGWELDSHTLSHPDLTTLDDATLARDSRTRAGRCSVASASPRTSSPTRPAVTTPVSRRPWRPRDTRPRPRSRRGSRRGATTRLPSTASA